MGSFVDSAMEHTAVSPAGFLCHTIVQLDNYDAKGPVPAVVRQLFGDGAPYDSCSHDTDIIHVHRARSLACARRSRAQSPWLHSTSAALATQQSGVRST